MVFGTFRPSALPSARSDGSQRKNKNHVAERPWHRGHSLLGRQRRESIAADKTPKLKEKNAAAQMLLRLEQTVSSGIVHRHCRVTWRIVFAGWAFAALSLLGISQLIVFVGRHQADDVPISDSDRCASDNARRAIIAGYRQNFVFLFITFLRVEGRNIVEYRRTVAGRECASSSAQ